MSTHLLNQKIHNNWVDCLLAGQGWKGFSNNHIPSDSEKKKNMRPFVFLRGF